MSTTTLTEKQRYFCDEYLKDMNCYGAAVRAGYSDNVARKGTLFHYPQIQQYIREQQRLNADKIKVTPEMILTELAKIAFSDDEKIAALNKSGKPVKISARNKMLALDKLAKHLGFYEKGR